ncbi:XTP/dITP diphosphatase [Petrachloros mirabilis]
MIKEIVLATRNRHKVEELTALLRDIVVHIRTLDEFPEVPEVVEDGDSCEANAVKKATAVAKATGLVSVADDTGLEVDALGGRPGVYAARYAGENVTYEDNWRKLLRELAGIPLERRTARFITAAAIASPEGDVKVTRGILDGRIAENPGGSKGFGYDPVFLVPQLGKTLAELSPEEKNQISHRARAFQQAKELLRTMQLV